MENEQTAERISDAIESLYAMASWPCDGSVEQLIAILEDKLNSITETIMQRMGYGTPTFN